MLAGDGEDRTGLEALTADLGVADRVRFLGFRSDVAAVMSALDVLLVPSTMPEAFPLAILEGMAAGRPVIATWVPGGIPEIVEDGVTGLLVPPYDPGALATAITRLLIDPHLRERLANAGRTRVAVRHDLPQMLDETERVYAELLGERRAGRAPARSGQGPGRAPASTPTSPKVTNRGRPRPAASGVTGHAPFRAVSPDSPASLAAPVAAVLLVDRICSRAAGNPALLAAVRVGARSPRRYRSAGRLRASWRSRRPRCRPRPHHL